MSRRRNRRTNPRQTAVRPQSADQQALRRSTPPSGIDKAAGLQIQETQVVQAHFAGPLPLPEHLSEYEGIAPGAAERIIKMAELQADHRRTMESKVVDSEVRLESRGQIFGFITVMTALVGGIGLMAFDKPMWGAAVSLSALASLAGVFVWSKRHKSRESSDKANPVGLGAEPTPPPQLSNNPGRS